MSAASHVGREVEIRALGRAWRMGRWTRAVWTEFLEWAKPLLPDPLAVAEKALARMPAQYHELIVRHAVDLSNEYLSLNSPQVQRCLSSVEGSTRLLYLLLRKNHPDITEDQAFDIFTDVDEKALKAAFDAAAGRAPAAAQGNAQAPAG